MSKDVLSGLRNANVFERGIYLSPGTYTLKIDKCLIRDTRKSDNCFFAECEVLSSSDTTAHPVGSRVSWCQSLRDKDVAFPALKSFIYAVLGFSYAKDKAKIVKEVDPNIEQLLYAACIKNEIVDNGENAFHGRTVNVQTYVKKTVGKGVDFTNHVWLPAQAA